MKIKSALLVALLGAVSIPQSALAVETPPGWHRTTDDTGITLTAIDDDNREVKLDISPLLSNDDNKSAAEYVQEFMDSSENSTEMQVTHRGEIQKKEKRAAITFQAKFGEIPAIITFVTYPVKKNAWRSIFVIMKDDVNVRKRHQKTDNKIIEAQYAEDMASQK